MILVINVWSTRFRMPCDGFALEVHVSLSVQVRVRGFHCDMSLSTFLNRGRSMAWALEPGFPTWSTRQKSA
jgi:hypothetical protein